ncbi:copper resistance protein CopC [Nonomuraea sp. ATR24]|uniref:copper resistance CopC family protein n=1 Tax=Nonomuraea sp. ATR24 TaxID=1676744 RepID=UPI0035BF24FE
MTHLYTFIRRAVAAAAGAALVLSLTAPAALAHDRLKSSSPADKAKIERLEMIELEFTSRMTMPIVVLEGPGGKPVPISKPRAEGTTVSARPEGELADGRYRIAWRVVSSDGHPIEGELRFTLAAPPTTESPTPSASDVPAAPSQPAPSVDPPSPAEAQPAAAEGGAGVPGWLLIAAVVLLLAGAAVFLVGRRSRSSGPGGT